MDKEIQLLREVEAIQIPSGNQITLPIGTPVSITQTLGGNYTVATSNGLARILAKDVEALGIDPNQIKKEEKHLEKLKNAPIEEQVWAQLKTVYDPEIPVDIVNLGLVYDCKIEEENKQYQVLIKMTLTAPGCGMGPQIAADAQSKIMMIKKVKNAEVELVWEPLWNQEMISEEGKMQLGIL